MKMLYEKNSKPFLLCMLFFALLLSGIYFKIQYEDERNKPYEKIVYIIQPGDTLHNIGKRHFHNTDQIYKWEKAVKEINGFNDNDKVILTVGEEIFILAKTERGESE